MLTVAWNILDYLQSAVYKGTKGKVYKPCMWVYEM